VNLFCFGHFHILDLSTIISAQHGRWSFLCVLERECMPSSAVDEAKSIL